MFFIISLYLSIIAYTLSPSQNIQNTPSLEKLRARHLPGHLQENLYEEGMNIGFLSLRPSVSHPFSSPQSIEACIKLIKQIEKHFPQDQYKYVGIGQSLAWLLTLMNIYHNEQDIRPYLLPASSLRKNKSSESQNAFKHHLKERNFTPEVCGNIFKKEKKKVLILDYVYAGNSMKVFFSVWQKLLEELPLEKKHLAEKSFRFLIFTDSFLYKHNFSLELVSTKKDFSTKEDETFTNSAIDDFNEQWTAPLLFEKLSQLFHEHMNQFIKSTPYPVYIKNLDHKFFDRVLKRFPQHFIPPSFEQYIYLSLTSREINFFSTTNDKDRLVPEFVIGCQNNVDNAPISNEYTPLVLSLLHHNLQLKKINVLSMDSFFSGSKFA